jgi:hypothetical protein
MDHAERMARWEFLGREFLTWLWFKSEEQGGTLDLGEMGEVEIGLDDRVTLRSDEDQTPETVTCLGESAGFREARFALTEEKKVTQARFRMTMGEDEWSFTLDSARLNFRSMRPPKVEQDTQEDPEGLFFERVGLVERAVSVLEALFLSFVKLRASGQWKDQEASAMATWIEEGMRGR